MKAKTKITCKILYHKCHLTYGRQCRVSEARWRGAADGRVLILSRPISMVMRISFSAYQYTRYSDGNEFPRIWLKNVFL